MLQRRPSPYLKFEKYSLSKIQQVSIERFSFFFPQIVTLLNFEKYELFKLEIEENENFFNFEKYKLFEF